MVFTGLMPFLPTNQWYKSCKVYCVIYHQMNDHYANEYEIKTKEYIDLKEKSKNLKTCKNIAQKTDISIDI